MFEVGGTLHLGAYPGIHNVSSQKESHVDHRVPSPVMGQHQRGDTATGSQEPEAIRGPP